MHLLATRFGHVTPSSPRCWSQQSRISAPNSSCGHTSTARHESCCRNGQPRRGSAPASEELAKGSFPTAFDHMLLPTSRIMRAAREKITQTSKRLPCPSSQSTVPMFALAASLSPQVPRAGAKPRLLWPPSSMPQSCRLNGNRTQHLHRLQVASIASGLSQSVPLVSSMPMSVDPIVSSTMFGLLCKHISLSMLCVAKQSIFLICPLLSMALVSLTPNRVSISALQSHLPPLRASSCCCSSAPTNPTRFLSVEKSSPGTASRSLVGHPVRPQVVPLHPTC